MPEQPTAAEQMQARVDRIAAIAIERDRKRREKPGQMALETPEEGDHE